MKRLFVVTTLAIFLSACSTISTQKSNLTKSPNGVRIIPSQVLIMVDGNLKKSRIMTVPDYDLAYDIKPHSVLAKHDFTVSFSDIGAATTITSNQDTTAFLDILGKAVDLAKKDSSGSPLINDEINGTFGLESGAYIWKNNRFIKVN